MHSQIKDPSAQKRFGPFQNGKLPLRKQSAETAVQSCLVRRHGLLIAKFYFLQMKLLFFISGKFGLAKGLYPAEKIVV